MDPSVSGSSGESSSPNTSNPDPGTSERQNPPFDEQIRDKLPETKTIRDGK
jgi:hypothetical protein